MLCGLPYMHLWFLLILLTLTVVCCLFRMKMNRLKWDCFSMPDGSNKNSFSFFTMNCLSTDYNRRLALGLNHNTDIYSCSGMVWPVCWRVAPFVSVHLVMAFITVFSSLLQFALHTLSSWILSLTSLHLPLIAFLLHSNLVVAWSLSIYTVYLAVPLTLWLCKLFYISRNCSLSFK